MSLIPDHTEDDLESSPHLFDLGDVSDEGLIIYKLQEFLQLIQITNVVLTDPLMFSVQHSTAQPLKPSSPHSIYITLIILDLMIWNISQSQLAIQ